MRTPTLSMETNATVATIISFTTLTQIDTEGVIDINYEEWITYII